MAQDTDDILREVTSKEYAYGFATGLTAFAFAAIGHQAAAQEDTVFIRKNIAPYDIALTYHTDTVVFDGPLARHVLVGSTILPASSKSETTRNYGLMLAGIQITPCEGGEKERPKPNEVKGVMRGAHNLTINTQVESNCCHSLLAEVEMLNDSTMNLIYHGYGTYCFCTCCFGLEYEFDKADFGNNDGIRFFMINGEEATLKRFD